MMKRFSGFLLLTLLAPLAHASGEAAWQENEQQSRQACLLASTLAQAKIVGKPGQFDDRTGYDALLLQGRYPQKHMKNRTGRELCLYHRQSGKAVVSEADQLRVAK